MDSASLEELMSENFPWIEPEDCSWQNVHDGHAPKLEAISAMLAENVGTGDVLLHVLGKPEVFAQMPASEAPGLISRHIFGGRIHASNREFSGFLVIMPIGVATAWRKGAHDI
jgi:hypothetical protein